MFIVPFRCSISLAREKKGITVTMEEVLVNMNWDDVICPICLDSPHNCVLLQCSSYEKGCRPFVCDTDHLHSNCLDRFRSAYGMASGSKSPSLSEAGSIESVEGSVKTEEECKPSCPLCRGDVTGWTAMDDNLREQLNGKKRGCEEHQCTFSGTYSELQKHARLEHPHARPSKIDPVRQLDWDNFQQSSEIIDVLSTIHREVPRGVVLGDYVIEYGGEDDTGDEFEDFPGDDGSWWTSCILYQLFDNLRNSRNRRRSRVSVTRRGSRRSSNSNSDDGSMASVEVADYRLDEIDDDDIINSTAPTRETSNHHSSRRRRSRFFDS